MKPCRQPSLFLLFIFMSLLLMISSLHAAPRHVFKVATLAPEGSVWMKTFNEFEKEVLEKTEGQVGFRIYPGGVMGDDKSILRKMQVGQLHGGGFTGTGISEMVPDFRVLGVPFLFQTYGEIDSTLEIVEPAFRKSFEQHGFILLAVTEIGFIYTMSTSPITSLEELRRSKCWSPEGDPVSQAYFETIEVSPVPLSIPDVLPALQTGLINTVFNSFYGAIALQWFTKTKFITDIPFAYSYGVFLIDKKRFDRLPPEYADVVIETAKKHFNALVQDARKNNEEALAVLKRNGSELLAVSSEEQNELLRYRDIMVDKAVGTFFSQAIYEAVLNHLRERRSQTN